MWHYIPTNPSKHQARNLGDSQVYYRAACRRVLRMGFPPQHFSLSLCDSVCEYLTGMSQSRKTRRSKQSSGNPQHKAANCKGAPRRPRGCTLCLRIGRPSSGCEFEITSHRHKLCCTLTSCSIKIERSPQGSPADCKALSLLILLRKACRPTFELDSLRAVASGSPIGKFYRRYSRTTRLTRHNPLVHCTNSIRILPPRQTTCACPMAQVCLTGCHNQDCSHGWVLLEIVLSAICPMMQPLRPILSPRNAVGWKSL